MSKQKFLLHTVVAACLVIVLSACGAKFSPQKLQKIRKGMPRAEVHRLLGKPRTVGEAKMIDYTGVADFYEEKGSSATIIFKNDKVEMLFANQDIVPLE